MNKKIIFFTLFFIQLCSAGDYTPGIFQNTGKNTSLDDRYDHRLIDGGFWFAVYDAYGGGEVANFLASDTGLADIFSKTDKDLPIKERMEKSFKIADESHSCNHQDISSSASVVYIKDNMIHFAHVGRSRAILIKNSSVAFTTQDHVPGRQDEYDRIIKNKGMITVNQQIVTYWSAGIERVITGNKQIVTDWRASIERMFTRAIGDHSFKPLLISTPEYDERSLAGGHLIIRSNDHYTLSNETIAKQIDKSKSEQEIADQLGDLLKKTIENRYQDNITVMVVDLEQLMIPKQTTPFIIIAGSVAFILISLFLYKYSINKS